MSKKPAAKKKPAKAVNVPRKPRAQRLPGTEDTAIQEIEDAAEDYADIRDQRQALTAKEVPAKAQLLAIMHKHGKLHYLRGKIEVDVVAEAETVKVKIKKQED